MCECACLCVCVWRGRKGRGGARGKAYRDRDCCKNIQTIETGIETGIETVVKTIQTIETVGRGFDFTPSCTVYMACMVFTTVSMPVSMLVSMQGPLTPPHRGSDMDAICQSWNKSLT